MVRALRVLLVLVATLSGDCAKRPAGAPEPPRLTRTPAPDGVPIAYTVQGRGRTTLVFIHGWSCDRTYWSEQVGPFARTRRVVAMDLAGHGESGVGRKEWTLQGLADDVVAMLEAENLRNVIFVGHSMGGPVSLLSARAVPDRVKGVVAVDALHDAEASNEQYELFADTLEADFAGKLEQMVSQFLFRPGADPALVERIASDMAQAPPEVAIPLIRSLAKLDLKSALAAVSVPIRGINTSPTNIAGNRKYAADFDAVLMSGVGHFPMLERPNEFNTLLERVVSEVESRRLR